MTNCGLVQRVHFVELDLSSRSHRASQGRRWHQAEENMWKHVSWSDEGGHR